MNLTGIVDMSDNTLSVGVLRFAIHLDDLEGGLNYCGSDEHTESITNTIDKWSVGIGSYDMNDDYFHQDEPHKGYDVWRSEDNLGFSFVLLDRTIDKITFLVAWIENREISNVDYESVLDFWLT